MLPELHHLRRLILLPRHRPAAVRTALSALVSVSASSGLLDHALAHFRSLRSQFPSHPPSARLYNCLLKCSLRAHRADLVEVLYRDMLLAGVPPETYTFNILISSLCDSDRIEEARLLFDNMPLKNCQPDEFSFGILICRYCKAGLTHRAVELLDEMERLGRSPNIVIYNTLISSFCKDGSIGEAEKLVERMRKDGLFPNVVTFNSRISALCKAGRVLEAYQIFRDMQEDKVLGLPRPNQITFNLMLAGFCKGDMLEEARALVELMKVGGSLASLQSYNIWLSGLVKCGRLLEAQQLLEEMVQQAQAMFHGALTACGQKEVLYSLMCNEYFMYGKISEAKEFLQIALEKEFSLEHFPYKNIVEELCKEDMIDDGHSLINTMIAKRYLFDPATFMPVIDALGKKGNKHEADKLSEKMMDMAAHHDGSMCKKVGVKEAYQPHDHRILISLTSGRSPIDSNVE
ncbi:hypothetical protein BHE74_00059890 [Ensete ventricosum]|nr:hypothetical protein GW17_00009402 [Ensete ventricosum]RWW35204.1 hypothetical protein BHE74_00059890 [Ensete ventricosum]